MITVSLDNSEAYFKNKRESDKTPDIESSMGFVKFKKLYKVNNEDVEYNELTVDLPESDSTSKSLISKLFSKFSSDEEIDLGVLKYEPREKYFYPDFNILCEYDRDKDGIKDCVDEDMNGDGIDDVATTVNIYVDGREQKTIFPFPGNETEYEISIAESVDLEIEELFIPSFCEFFSGSNIIKCNPEVNKDEGTYKALFYFNLNNQFGFIDLTVTVIDEDEVIRPTQNDIYSKKIFEGIEGKAVCAPQICQIGDDIFTAFVVADRCDISYSGALKLYKFKKGWDIEETPLTLTENMANKTDSGSEKFSDSVSNYKLLCVNDYLTLFYTPSYSESNYSRLFVYKASDGTNYDEPFGSSNTYGYFNQLTAGPSIQDRSNLVMLFTPNNKSLSMRLFDLDTKEIYDPTGVTSSYGLSVYASGDYFLMTSFFDAFVTKDDDTDEVFAAILSGQESGDLLGIFFDPSSSSVSVDSMITMDEDVLKDSMYAFSSSYEDTVHVLRANDSLTKLLFKSVIEKVVGGERELISSIVDSNQKLIMNNPNSRYLDIFWLGGETTTTKWIKHMIIESASGDRVLYESIVSTQQASPSDPLSMPYKAGAGGTNTFSAISGERAGEWIIATVDWSYTVNCTDGCIDQFSLSYIKSEN